MGEVQQINFSFQGGLSTEQDEFQIQPPNLLLAENVRFTEDGKINKRPGTTPLSTQVVGGTNIQTVQSLEVYNNELVLFDGQSVYTWLPSVSQWLNRGSAFAVVNQQYSIVRNSYQQNNVDGTSLNGLECYVWEDSSGSIQCSVLDSMTKGFVLSAYPLYAAGNSPKVIQGNNEFYIVFRLANTVMGLFTINTNTPNIVSQLSTVFSNGIGGGFHYDACSFNDSPIIVYNDNQFNISVIYNGITYNHQIPALDSSQINCIATCIDSTNTLWIAYNVYNVSENKIVIYTFNLETQAYVLKEIVAATELTTNPITNLTIVENPQSLGSVLICDEVDSGVYINIWQLNSNGVNVIYSNGVPVYAQQVRGVALASKAFKYGNNAFVNTVWVSPADTIQPTYFTNCLTSSIANAPISKYNVSVAGGARTNQLLAQCDVYNNTNGLFLVAGQRAGIFQTQNNTSFSLLGLNANFLNFNNPNAFNCVQNANNLIISGGIVQVYDGTSVVEDNFNIWPENITATVIDQDGTFMDGYYQYEITYEWTDQQGNIHRSQPSDPVLIDGLSIYVVPGNAVTLSIPTLRITGKQNPRAPVDIVIYRTLGADGGGSVFLKVAALTNNINVDFVTYTDTASDASIAANLPIYTSSQVANNSPPSCNLICNYTGRTLISGLDDPNLLWFSQSRYDLSDYNSTPIEWSDLFTIGTDPYGNNGLQGITAIQKMDNNVIIFKETAIYSTNSDGPNPEGTGDQFPLPQLITSETGCNNPNSIVFCPLGLLFKSDKGIFVLKRDGSGPSYIGSQVEAFNDLTITSAQLIDQFNEVVFTTLEGTALVWNYFFNRWYVWKNLPAVDSVIWNNQLVIVQDNGLCLVQDNTGTVWSDNIVNPVILKIQLPWIGGAMQGWNMVYSCLLLGNMLGQHLLECSVEYDYNDGIVESVYINSNMCSNTWGNQSWGPNGFWGSGNPTPYQFHINFSRPMCQAIRLTFQDYQDSPYTQGYSLSNLQFNVQILGGTGRVPAVRRFGTNVTGGF